jgi:hypothetical protein
VASHKTSKINRQQPLSVHLSDSEKYQRIVEHIGKMIVDLTLKDLGDERKSIGAASAYCLPCLPTLKFSRQIHSCLLDD